MALPELQTLTMSLLPLPPAVPPLNPRLGDYKYRQCHPIRRTNYNTVTWTPVPGVVQYKIYRNYSSGTPSSEGLIGTVNAENGNSGSQTFNDTGIAGTTAPPKSDTDEEITIYQPSTDKEWEFWHFAKIVAVIGLPVLGWWNDRCLYWQWYFPG
jgi:hypothetical protein